MADETNTGGLSDAERNRIQDSSGAPGRLSRAHFATVERIVAEREAALRERIVRDIESDPYLSFDAKWISAIGHAAQIARADRLTTDTP